MRSSVFAAAIILIGAATPFAGPQARPATPPATAKAAQAPPGQQLFMKYGCYQCHGREAQGGAAGPRLGPSPRPYEEFEEYTRAPSGDMPPYSPKILPDADLRAIHAYVAARPKPKPRTER